MVTVASRGVHASLMVGFFDNAKSERKLCGDDLVIAAQSAALMIRPTLGVGLSRTGEVSEDPSPH